MKTNFFRYVFGLFIMSILCMSCKSSALTQLEGEKDFIILNTGDTIYGKKIRLSRGFNKVGQVKIVKASGKKLVYEYDKVYQVHQYRKSKNFYVQEFVMLTPNNSVSYTLMDIEVNTGNVKLFEHNPTRMPNIPFVVSDFFHGYVRNQTEFNNLLNKLDTCEAFLVKFTKKEQRKRSNLKKLIEFYNANCGSL